MPNWGELFRLSTPIAETVVRGKVMLLALFAMMRVTGQREAGGHSLTDLLVVVLIAEAAGNGLAGEYRGLPDGLLLVATILFWSVTLDAAAYRWPRLAGVLKSRPKPLIADGQVNQRALRREFMHRDELMAQLRLHGITDVREVARAYLEPNGMVSVIRKDQATVDDPPKPPAAG
jgi:uncharacterized membrane protein YcaP (DUF421 family)